MCAFLCTGAHRESGGVCLTWFLPHKVKGLISGDFFSVSKIEERYIPKTDLKIGVKLHVLIYPLDVPFSF